MMMIMMITMMIMVTTMMTMMMMMMTMIPVGDLDGVVRSRSQPLQKYHLGVGHGPPQKKR